MHVICSISVSDRIKSCLVQYLFFKLNTLGQPMILKENIAFCLFSNMYPTIEKVRLILHVTLTMCVQYGPYDMVKAVKSCIVYTV